MFKLKILSLVTLSFITCWGGTSVLCFAGEHAEGGGAAGLAQALKKAKIPLGEGLSVSKKYGVPISAKYEVDNGELQLSVYTMKGNGFSEVIVNYRDGTIDKSEAITGGHDLTAAKAQSEAMTKAKKSLEKVIHDVLKKNKEYLAVSITSKIEGGHPVADITLMKKNESKVVIERLD